MPPLPATDLAPRDPSNPIGPFDDLPEELREPDSASPAGRIFDAAREVFAERGFDGSSTRAIAERAGMNQALVHYYFGSKEKLYRRVLAVSMLQVLRHQAEDRVGVLPADRLLIEFPARLLDWFRGHPLVARLLRREVGSGAARLAPLMRELGPQGPLGMRPRIEAAFRAGVAAGELRDLPFASVFSCLLALSYGFILMEPMLRAVFGDEGLDGAGLEARSETIAALLSGGLRPGASAEPAKSAQLGLFGEEAPAPRPAPAKTGRAAAVPRARAEGNGAAGDDA